MSTAVQTQRPVTRDCYAMTQAEVAQALGVTRGDVWNIEKRALEKARRVLETHGVVAADVIDVLRAQ